MSLRSSSEEAPHEATAPASADPPSGMVSSGMVMLIMLAQAALFTGLGVLLWWFTGRELARFVTFEGSQIILGCGFAGALTGLAAAYFYGLRKSSDELVKMQGPSYPFLENRLGALPIIVISLFAGIGEEALFRGGLQTLLGDFLPIWLAIGLSSAGFALIHLSRPIVCFLQFLIGVIFGIVFWQTGSLLAVMIGHGLYDIFALWYVQKRLHELNFFAPTEGP